MVSYNQRYNIVSSQPGWHSQEIKFCFMKSKNVNPKWVFGPNGLNVELVQLIAKMFLCNVTYFFERLKEFIQEFKDITYFTPDKKFLTKIKEGPFVCNRLFDGLIMCRLFGVGKPIPIYLDKSMTLVGSRRINLSDLHGMEEKYFWAIWYALTVDPQKIPGSEIFTPLEGIRYHFAFNQGDSNEDPFLEIVYVTMEQKNGKWHYDAFHYSDKIAIQFNETSIYCFLKKRD